MKRTTLMVDPKLLELARRCLGTRTFSDTVNLSLSEAVRREKDLALRGLFGADFWEGDLTVMRRTRFPPRARKAAAASRR